MLQSWNFANLPHRPLGDRFGDLAHLGELERARKLHVDADRHALKPSLKVVEAAIAFEGAYLTVRDVAQFLECGTIAARRRWPLVRESHKGSIGG